MSLKHCLEVPLSVCAKTLWNHLITTVTYELLLCYCLFIIRPTSCCQCRSFTCCQSTIQVQLYCWRGGENRPGCGPHWALSQVLHRWQIHDADYCVSMKAVSFTPSLTPLLPLLIPLSPIYLLSVTPCYSPAAPCCPLPLHPPLLLSCCPLPPLLCPLLSLVVFLSPCFYHSVALLPLWCPLVAALLLSCCPFVAALLSLCRPLLHLWRPLLPLVTPLCPPAAPGTLCLAAPSLCPAVQALWCQRTGWLSPTPTWSPAALQGLVSSTSR